MLQRQSSSISYSTDGHTPARRAMIRLMESVSGQRKLQRLYDSLAHLDLDGRSFWGRALSELSIDVQLDGGNFDSIKDAGPVVVIANHPFGVVDGLALCHLTAQARPDFKVILHKVLCQDTRLQGHVLPIDFAGTRDATKANVRTKREAEKVLKDGGTVVVFPAGGVSTASGWRQPATDLDWKPLTPRLIQRTGARVLPVFFHGQNSPVFHVSSRLSPTMRAGMLLHEVRNKIGKPVRAHVGDLIEQEEISHMQDADALSAYLRQRVYQLGACPLVA